MRVVVETHADDAYLSVGSFLRDWAGERPLLLVTVCSGTRERGKDAARFADEVGAEWLGLGHVDRVANGDGVAEFPGLENDLRSLATDGVTLVGPLGLGHPEHRGVAAALPDGALRYLDQPVAGKRKSRGEVEDALRGRTIDALRIATVRDYACHDLFRDQARFMLYNPPRDLARLPQVVVR